MMAVMTTLIGRWVAYLQGRWLRFRDCTAASSPARWASWRACPATRSASGRAAASSAPRSPTRSRGAIRSRTSRRPRWSPRCSARGVRHADVHRASERLARRSGRWPLSDARLGTIVEDGGRPRIVLLEEGRRLRARLAGLAADGRAAAGRGCARAAPPHPVALRRRAARVRHFGGGRGLRRRGCWPSGSRPSRGERVLVIDRRDHIAGNAYDYVDEHGVLLPFATGRTSSTRSPRGSWSYLSRFTEWRPVRAPGAGRGRRAAAPVPDQPHHARWPLRARAAHRRGSRGVLRRPRASRAASLSQLRGRRGQPRSAATSTRRSSAATRASTGGLDPAELYVLGHRPATQCGPMTTTATSRTRTRAMPVDGYTRHVRAHPRPPEHRGRPPGPTSPTCATRSTSAT